MYGFTALPLLNNGYQPIPIRPGTKQPDSNGWQNEQGEAIVQQHIRTKPNHGVGVNNINALDFDILDPDISSQMEIMVRQMHPNLLKRVGLPPKFLVPIHANSGVSRKISSAWMNGEQKNEIEILHAGQQQFVVFGDHPGTGNPYQWYGSDLLHVPADQLPVVTEDQISSLISQFDSLCEAKGFTRAGTSPKGPTAPQGTAEEQTLWSNIPDHVKGPQTDNPFAVPPETIPFDIPKQCIDLLPLHHCDDRDDWFKIGGIIYDVTGGSTEGFNLFDTWSQKSLKYNAKPGDTTALKWKGYTIKDGNAGLGTLFHYLELAGIPIPTGQQAASEPPPPPGPNLQPLGSAPQQQPPEEDMAMSFDIARGRFMYLQLNNEVGDFADRTVVKFSHKKIALAKYDRLAPGKSASKSFLATWIKDPKSLVGMREWFRPVKDMPIIYEDGLKYFNSYAPQNIPKVDKWDPAIVEPMLVHIRYIMPEKVVYNAFLDWLANKWVSPRDKAYAFLIITSSQQIGKGALLALLKVMFGQNRVVPADATTFTEKAGAFNEYLDGSLINFCDEARFNKTAYDKLKAWVYEPYLHVNKKNSFKGTVETFSNWLIFSNHLDSAVINLEDKRLAVSIMREGKLPDEHYTDLWARINDPEKVMVSHFVAMLEDRDISKFKRHEPPWSEAKASMVAASKDDANYIIEQMILDETGPCKYDITSANLVYHYLKTFELELKTSRKQVSAILERLTTTRRLGSYWVEVGPHDNQNGSLFNSKRQRGLLCLRHFNTMQCWKDAGNDELKLEYLRSREAAVLPHKSKEDINKMPSYEMAV